MRGHGKNTFRKGTPICPLFSRLYLQSSLLLKIWGQNRSSIILCMPSLHVSVGVLPRSPAVIHCHSHQRPSSSPLSQRVVATTSSRCAIRSVPAFAYVVLYLVEILLWSIYCFVNLTNLAYPSIGHVDEDYFSTMNLCETIFGRWLQSVETSWLMQISQDIKMHVLLYNNYFTINSVVLP
jgi:hypothetical protein